MTTTTTKTQRPSLWVRTVNRVSRFDQTINIDSTRYAPDWVNTLGKELTVPKTRDEHLEAGSDQISEASSSKAAAWFPSRWLC